MMIGGGGASTGNGGGSGAAAPPNPFGKKGGPAHQAKVGEVAADIESRGLEASFEHDVPTPGGTKGTRYVDVVGKDAQGNVVEMHQVGRQTKGGAGVERGQGARRHPACNRNSAPISPVQLRLHWDIRSHSISIPRTWWLWSKPSGRWGRCLFSTVGHMCRSPESWIVRALRKASSLGYSFTWLALRISRQL